VDLNSQAEALGIAFEQARGLPQAGFAVWVDRATNIICFTGRRLPDRGDLKLSGSLASEWG